MIISIDLPVSQLELLNKEAGKLGIRSEELARAAITDIINVPDEDFASVAEYVLKKNKELYNRLK
jgi:antitoxin FitA